jgi:hypothetical protein
MNALGPALVFVLAASVGANAWARGPWRADEGNTPGWALMSPEERVEHQAMVRRFTRYDECHDYQLAHHRLMEERALKLGLPPPRGGRDFCAHLPRSPSFDPQ